MSIHILALSKQNYQCTNKLWVNSFSFLEIGAIDRFISGIEICVSVFLFSHRFCTPCFVTTLLTLICEYRYSYITNYGVNSLEERVHT